MTAVSFHMFSNSPFNIFHCKRRSVVSAVDNKFASNYIMCSVFKRISCQQVENYRMLRFQKLSRVANSKRSHQFALQSSFRNQTQAAVWLLNYSVWYAHTATYLPIHRHICTSLDTSAHTPTHLHIPRNISTYPYTSAHNLTYLHIPLHICT